MVSSQRCVIYKSLRKADAYLYVIEVDEFAMVPLELREMLGRLEYVMALQLTPERKLARADAIQVMEALSGQGYYLQLPPPLGVAAGVDTAS
jgi:uncharacterized protein YcgL (UPF0745 family)